MKKPGHVSPRARQSVDVDYDRPKLPASIHRFNGRAVPRVSPLRRLIFDDKVCLNKVDEALANPVGTNQHSLPLYNVQALPRAPTGNSVETFLRRLRADARPLAKEHIDLDAVADQEHSTDLLKEKLKATGRPKEDEKGTPGVPSKGGTDRRAARLATRRPDLAEAVRSGRM